MLRKSSYFAFIFLSLVFIFPVLVLAKPQAPTPPPNPEAPAPPDTSGVYDVPERQGMKVRVFAHPAKPTPPPRPGTSPEPSPVAVTSLACGLIDPDATAIVSKAGWRIPNGNWTYILNLNSVPSTVGQNNLDQIVKAGFNQYMTASGNKINFTRGANTTVNRSRLDGRNIISWGRASPGTLGVTYIWYYPSTGLAVEIDTIMNNRYKWNWSNSNVCADNITYDAQNIMTHELGHWLGLSDEYDSGNFGNHTMYGYGSPGEVKKNTLTTGDVSGIGTIYTP